jgi:superfamily II DNA or RNA helicase
MMGRILGRVLEQEQIKFLYYFGEMTREEKEDNVKGFHVRDDIKVLVASLRCGGQGLNLTCANRVIMIDPWWNSALEQQAYGRVFRMGQTKETWYARLLTRKTIDGRMAKLQNEKLRQINAVVDEYDSTRQSLKFEEVAELFGRVKRDEEGNAISVESDYDTDDDEAFDDDEEDDDADGGNANGAGPSQPGTAFDEPGVTFGDSVVNGYGIQDLLD